MKKIKQPVSYGNCKIVAVVAVVLLSTVDGESTFNQKAIEVLNAKFRDGVHVCKNMTNELLGDAAPTSIEAVDTTFRSLGLAVCTHSKMTDQPVEANLEPQTDDVVIFHPTFTTADPVIATEDYELTGALVATNRDSLHQLAVVRVGRDMCAHLGYDNNDCNLVELRDALYNNRKEPRDAASDEEPPNRVKCTNVYVVEAKDICSAKKLPITSRYAVDMLQSMVDDTKALKTLRNVSEDFYAKLNNKHELNKQRFKTITLNELNIDSAGEYGVHVFDIDFLHNVSWIYARKAKRVDDWTSWESVSMDAAECFDHTDVYDGVLFPDEAPNDACRSKIIKDNVTAHGIVVFRTEPGDDFSNENALLFVRKTAHGAEYANCRVMGADQSLT